MAGEKFDAAMSGVRYYQRLYEDAVAAEIKSIQTKIADGKASYADVLRLSSYTGKAAGKILANQLAVYARGGQVDVEAVRALLPPALRCNYDYVSEVAAKVQQGLNRRAGLGLKAVRAEFDTDRVNGIVTELAQTRDFAALSNRFIQQVENLSMSIVDNTIRANADLHLRMGLRPRIVRRAAGGCCPWCAALAGTYDYEEVRDTGNDVFRRHTNCNCTVTYDPADGTLQDVWSKAKWVGNDPTERIAAINELNAQRSAKAQARAIARKERDSAIKALMQERGMSAKQASIYYNMRIRPSKNT